MMQAEAGNRIAEDGVLIVRSVFQEEEARSILEHFDQVDLHRSRAGVRHLMSDHIVRKVADDARMANIAEAALGAAAIPFRATLFDKSADANWLVVWHQDTALPLTCRIDGSDWSSWSSKEGVLYAHAPSWALEQVVALRLHLDHSTSENGPLRVVPGSHHAGVLSDDQIEGVVAATPEIECVVDLGGVVLMQPLIVHASSKSRSSNPRRVLHIEYATESLGRTIPLACS